ncbi:MAG: hypothetical protein PHU71_05075 [Candidatus Gracilibacteria bacterium]|nr:hypothetical protein [Candidatus Gracilibacteria bacterium]
MKLYRHLNLTPELQSIIGKNEVEYAYSTITEDDITDGHSIDPMSDFQLNSIQPGLNPVIVKMKNGKLFKIWVSEAGGIESIDTDSDIEEL